MEFAFAWNLEVVEWGGREGGRVEPEWHKKEPRLPRLSFASVPILPFRSLLSLF